MLIHGWQSKACQEAANNISCEPIMGCTTCTLRAARSTFELYEISSMLSTTYQGKWYGVISMWTDGLVHELQTVHNLHFRRCWQHPTWLRLASDMFAQCWCCDVAKHMCFAAWPKPAFRKLLAATQSFEACLKGNHVHGMPNTRCCSLSFISGWERYTKAGPTNYLEPRNYRKNTNSKLQTCEIV